MNAPTTTTPERPARSELWKIPTPAKPEGFARNPFVARKSGLDVLAAESPAHYLEWCRQQTEDTPALIFGRAFHCFVLEQVEFSKRYAVAPEFGDLRTKIAKEARDAFLAEIGEREMVKQADFDTIRRMADAIAAHPTARNLVVAGEAEKRLEWIDAETGLVCRGVADFHIKPLRMAIDLKSTESAAPHLFAKSIAKFRYHVQDEIYREGFTATGEPIDYFVFVAVEKAAPFGVSVCYVDDAALERGEQLLRRDMATLKRCADANEWPCYSPDLVPVSLPAWAFYDN